MKITVYTKPYSTSCAATFAAFDAIGLKEDEYDRVDITKDEEALRIVSSYHCTQLPVVVIGIDGMELDRWEGYQPDKIDTLLKLPPSLKKL